MSEFIFTSPLFSGFLKFAYNDEDILIKFENNASLGTQQLMFLQRNFPFVRHDLDLIKGKSGKIEQHIDITFENFWLTYGYKRGKQQTQIQWNRLSDDAKFKAIAYIPKYKYDSKLKGHDLLYPERYLKYRRFEDE